MPELPEVETIKRELETSVRGRTITRCVVNYPRIVKEPGKDSFIRAVTGASITAIIRKGKILICELSTGKALTVHLRMTGQLIYPGSGTDSRVSLYFSDGSILDMRDRRGLGEIRLRDDWRSLAFIKELGPEPFDITLEQFTHMLAGKKTRIKVLLMDQTFISGVGNLYAAEALFRARISPERMTASLADKEKALLFKEILATLREAIKYRGSSVDQYVTLSGKPGGFVVHHKVYGRAGKPCVICGIPIRKTTLGGRGTYFCSTCQK